MDKSPSTFDYCIGHRTYNSLSSPYRYLTHIRYRNIYAKAKIHKKCGIYTITALIDNVFEKALHSKRVLSLYCRLPIDNMFDKCTKYQDADEILDSDSNILNGE